MEGVLHTRAICPEKPGHLSRDFFRGLIPVTNRLLTWSGRGCKLPSSLVAGAAFAGHASCRLGWSRGMLARGMQGRLRGWLQVAVRWAGRGVVTGA